MPPVIEYAKDLPDDVELVAVPVTAEQGDAEGLEALGLPAAVLAAQGFAGKVDQIAVVPGADGAALVAVGLGPAAAVDADRLRRAAAQVVRAGRRVESVALPFLDVVADADRRREGRRRPGRRRGCRPRRLPLHRAALRARSVGPRSGRRGGQGRPEGRRRRGRGRPHRRGPEPRPRPRQHARRHPHPGGAGRGRRRHRQPRGPRRHRARARPRSPSAASAACSA